MGINTSSMMLILGILIGLLIALISLIVTTLVLLSGLLGSKLENAAKSLPGAFKREVEGAKGVVFTEKTLGEVLEKQKAEQEEAHLLDPLDNILKSRN